MLRHQSMLHTYACCGHCHNVQQHAKPAPSESFSFTPDDDIKSCAICEYKFTINQMPLFFRLNVPFKPVVTYLFPNNLNLVVCLGISDNPSRAPPVCFPMS
jgi:hypothetical protein